MGRISFIVCLGLLTVIPQLAWSEEVVSPSDGPIECPKQLPAPDERERIMEKYMQRPRDPDCDTQTDISKPAQDKVGRIWYRGRGGWVACPKEVEGAEAALNEALSNIFSTQEGKGWLKEIFGCDSKALSYFLGVSKEIAESVVKLCSTDWELRECVKPNGAKSKELQRMMELAPYPRRLLYLLGTTPADCVDSFTFPTGTTVLGFPSGSVSVERTQMLMMHEIALLLDGKSPLGEKLIKQISGREPLRALQAAAFPKFRTAFAALRALAVEKQILSKTAQWGRYNNNAEFKMLNGIQNNESKCLDALKAISRTMARTRLWGADEFPNANLVISTKGTTFVIVPDNIAGWSKETEAVLEKNLEHLRGHTISIGKETRSFCSYLATPKLDGLNIWSNGGPRPCVGCGD